MKGLSGYLLVILGFLHIVVGIFSAPKQILTIVSFGVWNALGQQSQEMCMNSLSCMQINTFAWFISFGLMLIVFGGLCVWVESTLQRAVPMIFGFTLLIISGVYAVLLPASGFWLVMAVAIYMMWFSCRTRAKQS